MLKGWPKFLQKTRAEAATCPDTAVAPARTWLIRAALLASTAALLGTSYAGPDSTASPPTPPGPRATYEFSRSVEGAALDLTRAQSTASFLITISALDLGPEGVITTGDAVIEVTAALTTSDISGDPPAAFLRVGTFTGQEFHESLTVAHPVVFQGTCDQPAPNAPCQAAIEIDFARIDDGLQGGTLHVDWSFELSSSGRVDAAQEETHASQDPPWSVEVAPQ